MYSIHIRRVFFLTVERRGESLTATNGKIDEGRSVSVWKWLVVWFVSNVLSLGVFGRQSLPVFTYTVES